MRLMKRKLCVAASSICWSLLSAGVIAKEVKVGTATVILPSPQGYCDLDTTHTAEARAVSDTERMLSTNRLLAFSADCEQLAEYRATKGATPLDNFAQYQTFASWENRRLPGPPEAIIKWVCRNMRAQGEKIAFNATSEIKARAEEVLKNVKVNDIQGLVLSAKNPLPVM